MLDIDKRDRKIEEKKLKVCILEISKLVKDNYITHKYSRVGVRKEIERIIREVIKDNEN